MLLPANSPSKLTSTLPKSLGVTSVGMEYNELLDPANSPSKLTSTLPKSLGVTRVGIQ